MAWRPQLGIVQAFGVAPGSNIGRGMFITLTYTATIFDKMVIAGASSITARGVKYRATSSSRVRARAR